MYYVDYSKEGNVVNRNAIVPTNVKAEGSVVSFDGNISRKASREISDLVAFTKIGESGKLYCVSEDAAEKVAQIIAENPRYERQ